MRSVYEQTKDIDFEVIVSDNGSVDGSIEMLKADFPQVILIENNANLGFGAANNRGLAIAKGKYIFYLNSDTILLNNAVKYFFDYWEHAAEQDTFGALGCNLLNADGRTISISHGCFFSLWGDIKMYVKMWLALFRGEKKAIARPDENAYYVGPVDIIIGADLFVKNDDFARFDEYFFLYHEEADLEYRLMQNGKKRLLIDGPQIIHLGGQSNVVRPKYSNYVSFSRIHDCISRVKYYKKNGTHWYEPLILKSLIFLMWTFPPLIPHTKKYWKELWAI